jgi:hypothetical protein
MSTARPRAGSTERSKTLTRAQSLTPAEFRRQCLLPNAPALLSAECTGTPDWGACRRWRLRADDGLPDARALRSLAAELGDPVVPVEYCDEAEEAEAAGPQRRAAYGERRRGEMALSAYLDAWEARAGGGACPYLKDWHIDRERGDAFARTLYEPPRHFEGDWLGPWAAAAARADDFRFVYLGPRASWTGLHHDVLGSYSWSANVAGVKRWLLFPPHAQPLLLLGAAAGGARALVPDARPAAHAAYAPAVAARLREALALHCVEIEQRCGQVVFVPAGWLHQVENVTDTLALNQNWTDGVGVGRLWDFLCAQARAVALALADVSPRSGSALAFPTEGEWRAQCALVLRADAGMDLADALEMAREGTRRVLGAHGGRLPADGSLDGVLHILDSCDGERGAVAGAAGRRPSERGYAAAARAGGGGGGHPEPPHLSAAATALLEEVRQDIAAARCAR